MKRFVLKMSRTYNIPVYVDELTDCMQLRIKTKDNDMSLFECGVDYRCQDVWASTTGIWGVNIQDFVATYLRLRYEGSLASIEYVKVCDDPIYEDSENTKVYAPIAWASTEVIDVNNISE